MAQQLPDLGPRSTRSASAGNGLFLAAMVLIAVAMVLGPIVVITKSGALLNAAVALGVIGVASAVFAAIRSYIS